MVVVEAFSGGLLASLIVGNRSEMTPRSVQAPLLRKKGPGRFVIYTICLVVYVCPWASGPDRRTGTAPRIVMFSPIAELILVVTGMRSDVV